MRIDFLLLAAAFAWSVAYADEACKPTQLKNPALTLSENGDVTVIVDANTGAVEKVLK